MSNAITTNSWNPIPAVTNYAQQTYQSAANAAQNATSNFSVDNLDIGKIGGTIGSGIGGGVAAFFQAKNVATAFGAGKAATTAATAARVAETGNKLSFLGKVSNGVKGMVGGFKAALPNLAKGAGIGAAVSGVVSAGINGFRAINGEITGRQFAGEVVADTVVGGLSSLGGLGLAAGVTALAGTILGGLPLAILGVGAGIAGSLLADKAMDKLGVRSGIRGLIAGGDDAGTTATQPTDGGNQLPPVGPTPPGFDF